MRVADYIMQFIAAQGVKHVFMLPGGGCMHLADALARSKKLKYVACLHEQAAAIAADGYAQFTQNIGVCLVTTGPGSTNAVTGCYGAWAESTPVLFLSGQVKTADIKDEPEMRMRGFQEVDIISMVKPVTKYAATVTCANKVRFHLEAALHYAKSGRPGPVWLAVPLDVQAQECKHDDMSSFTPPFAKPRLDLLHVSALRTLAALAKAKRPVILAGNGVRIAGATDLLREFADRCGVPVVLSYKAADLLPEDHPLNAGRPGTIALRWANFAVQNSDFVLAIGARLDYGQTGYNAEQFAPHARKVAVDLDWLELVKHTVKLDDRVCADAGDFLRESLAQWPLFHFPSVADWAQTCRDWKAQYPAVTAAMRKQRHCVNTYVLMEELSKHMTPDDILVPGSSGACSEVALQSFQVKEGQRVINSPSIGSMGFGLPQAIGVAVASGRRVVCVNGDGGFQMNVQELETVRRLNLNIKFFVLDNQGYASMRATSRNHFKGRMVASGKESGLTLPDVLKQALAYGIHTNRIGDHSQLVAGVKMALSSDGPFICKVVVDPDEQPQPRVRSRVASDGSMVTGTLHDMWPYLSRKELAKNMLAV